MKTRLFLFLAAGMAALNSCTVTSSLYPLSSRPDQCIIKNEFSGIWYFKDDSSQLYSIDTLAKNSLHEYQILCLDMDTTDTMADSVYFRARLVQLHDSLYLDTYFELGKNDKNNMDLELLTVTRHFIFRLHFISADTILFQEPDPVGVISLIDKKKIHLTYAGLGEDNFLILDKSEQLQKAITESEKYKWLYKNTRLLIRVK
ncbi:MAG: hypothetical protein IPP93_04245 [Chitinophagaceae bacterium]|nr:hypothetical protein [Chitinophagaceae bacterium]